MYLRFHCLCLYRGERLGPPKFFSGYMHSPAHMHDLLDCQEQAGALQSLLWHIILYFFKFLVILYLALISITALAAVMLNSCCWLFKQIPWGCGIYYNEYNKKLMGGINLMQRVWEGNDLRAEHDWWAIFTKQRRRADIQKKKASLEPIKFWELIVYGD